MSKDVQSKVPEFREKFLNKYEGSILDDTYDARDVARVKTDDGYLRSFLMAYRSNGDVNKAMDLLNESLKWRAKFKVNDLKEEDLDEEFVKNKTIAYHGVDKEGHKIIILQLKYHKRGVKVEECKQLLAFLIEQHYKEHPVEQLTYINDFTDAGVGNMDLDVAKWIINANGIYYPNIAAHNLIFKMGVALATVWKIIKGFMDPEQSKKTVFVNRRNIQEYIDANQLLPHMLKEDEN